MRPEQYEQWVAEILRTEGWDAHVTPYQRDFGVDVLAERDGRRLGVQAKMWAGANRRVAEPEVMQLYGAAAFADCDAAMIVTDSELVDKARVIADKLEITVRTIPSEGSSAHGVSAEDTAGDPRFGHVWEQHIEPLEGKTLQRDSGKQNDILCVDWGGLVRRTSRDRPQRIDIEIFRWAIERVLHGETVSREEINDRYARRASSGIMLVLAQVPLFERVRVRRKECVRLRVAPA